MNGSPKLLLLGFIAGFLAVFLFHQIAVILLSAAGIAPASVSGFNMQPVPPFGVPAVFSAAFWGGLWGIVFALVQTRFPHGGGYWGAALAFGAVLPTLVALLIVAPLKGGPIGAGWQPQIWLFAAIVNGAWGLGTGVFLKLMAPRLTASPA